MDEARKCLDGIGYSPLEQTFRANKRCDELQRLGTSFRPLSDDAGVTGTDNKIWDEFCQALELREGEVTDLYDKKLIDLRQFSYRVTDIELLKKLVNDTSEMLVIQKPKFGLLSKQAKAMRDRLD